MTPAHRHRAFLLLLLSSRALGFVGRRPQRPSVMCAAEATRADFISTLAWSATTVLWAPAVARGFEGGVGGLGKTRPQTGVVFRDPDAAAGTSQSTAGDASYELVAPDGTPVFLSFAAPWPLSKSAAGIEARDISGGFESTYVQVVAAPRGVAAADDVKPALLSEAIFGPSGKFGMYGAPTDIKIKKLPPQSSGSTETGNAAGATLYQASFTALTPAMRESDRKAYISAAVAGDGLFLLVTTTTAARFGKLEGTLRRVAESFAAVAAPKSSLNARKPPP